MKRGRGEGTEGGLVSLKRERKREKEAKGERRIAREREDGRM